MELEVPVVAHHVRAEAVRAHPHAEEHVEREARREPVALITFILRRLRPQCSSGERSYSAQMAVLLGSIGAKGAEN